MQHLYKQAVDVHQIIETVRTDYISFRQNLRVRCVPFADSHEAIFSVSFVGSSHSELNFQSRLGTHNGPHTMVAGGKLRPYAAARNNQIIALILFSI
jgi:hypothetical protein